MQKKNYEDGLKVDFVKYREFGKFKINFHMLNDDNKLVCSYKSNAGIKELQKQTISEQFKTIINDIDQSNTINYNIAKTLNDKEKLLLTNLLIKSGLSTQLKFNKNLLNYSVQELKNQFNIVQGEIASGNNNAELRTDAIVLLRKLINCNGITQEKGDEIIDELQNF